jgi:multidrug efflux pump subunit AcrA (membrane-fusion protein)
VLARFSAGGAPPARGLILFVHPNFPEQFGPILSKLSGRRDVECVFVTKAAAGVRDSVILAEISVLEAKENREVAELERAKARATDAAEPGHRRCHRAPAVAREVRPGTAIAKLAQIHPLRVEVIVPVALLGKIAVGARAEVQPEAPVAGSYPAIVAVVDRVVDAASGTFGVRLELPNPDYRLPAGLTCKVRFGR